MKSLIAILLAALVWDARGEDTFNVRDYGAKGDGQTQDTVAIQKALNACGKAGGGIVVFPPGTYLSKPITIRDETTFQLDAGATLLASTNQADFMKTPGDWTKARGNDFMPFIYGRNLTHIMFTGGGTIDGSGGVWWGEAEKARERVSGYTLPRPNLVVLQQCQNVRMENITLQNSPKYNFVPDECTDLVCSNVTILNPPRSANTDGIDPSACENVLITKCRIDTGDDNIAIKSGHAVAGREFACENLVVSDCTFLHGHGMSIGSETSGGVRNLTVTNCTFEDTENGIRIKSQRGKGGRVENILYEDLTMKNVDPAITFTSYYMYSSAGDAVQKATPQQDAAQAVTQGTPIYRNIRIKNLTATCQRGAGLIMGLPEAPIAGVVFENVHISAASGMKVQNASGIEFQNSQVTAQAGEPFILQNAQVKGIQ